MILVDTSVWIDHFRVANAKLAVLTSNIEVIQHPFVSGELAMGNLADWARTVARLGNLPQAEVLKRHAFIAFLEENALMGTGIGFVDAHLLAACMMSSHTLWTKDRRLAKEAKRIGVTLLA